MTFDQMLQVALILATIVPVLLALHQQNRRGRLEIIKKLGKLSIAFKAHDKRVRKLRNGLRELERHVYGSAKERIDQAGNDARAAARGKIRREGA